MTTHTEGRKRGEVDGMIRRRVVDEKELATTRWWEYTYGRKEVERGVDIWPTPPLKPLDLFILWGGRREREKGERGAG